MMMGVMDDEDQYGDEETYLPYVYSMEGGDPGVNWEERCLELEMSLQRFRDQAGKIRGLLREKVSGKEFRIFLKKWSHLATWMCTVQCCLSKNKNDRRR